MLNRFFVALYRFFAPRRLLLFAVTAALLAAAAIACRGVRVQENIAAMLPDDQSAAAIDFQLLQQAPFARKVVISLRADPGVDLATLAGAGDRFAAALAGEGIERVVSGPAELGDGRLLFWLAEALPALATPADLERLAAELTPADVAARLQQGYERLLSPDGWGIQPLLRADPLELRRLALEKLRHVNLIPGAQLEQNHFVSADGRNLLLVADTPIVITDSDGARQIEERFDTAAATLPPGVTAAYVSGHRYTQANAEAIKRDLALILSLSSLAVLAIYLIFLRSFWALFVFLVPATVLVLASGFLTLASDQVFAITLGFGGVLLGIADEYAMNVYFACRRCQGDPAPLLGEVSRPVLFSGLTTLATFAVMLLSALPGQRQLAVYAMSGIAASLFISLVVLPHLVPAAPAVEKLAPARSGRRRLPRAWVLGGWLFLLLGCASQIGKLRFDGDLRSMNLVPAELRAAERDLQQTWGNLRGQAIAFVEGRDVEAALAGNEQLFACLSTSLPPGEVVSLAPLLPSSATQRENRARWVAFWQGKTGESILRELENRQAPSFAPVPLMLSGRCWPRRPPAPGSRSCGQRGWARWSTPCWCARRGGCGY
jgi:predicted exporter